MSKEKNYYKEIFLFTEDVVQIIEAITSVQSNWRNEKDGGEIWDSYCQKKIDNLQAVLNKIHDTPYRELPTPNTLNK
jgi:predicted PolB exonuclease-like 3'-5' exonuclease